MRITRVHIENYRSIRELDLYPDDYTILIGDNNAGKSNILKAMNLVLGETWPTDRTFTLEDFHNHDSEQDIVIQVYFDTVLEKWKNMSLKVWGFELRGHAYKGLTGAFPGVPLRWTTPASMTRGDGPVPGRAPAGGQAGQDLV